MDGRKWKSLLNWMIWGGTPIFGNTHILYMYIYTLSAFFGRGIKQYTLLYCVYTSRVVWFMVPLESCIILECIFKTLQDFGSNLGFILKRRLSTLGI